MLSYFLLVSFDMQYQQANYLPTLFYIFYLIQIVGVITPVSLPQTKIVAFLSCSLSTEFILFYPFSVKTIWSLYKLGRLPFSTVSVIRYWDAMRILWIKTSCDLLKINNIFIQLCCCSMVHCMNFSPLKMGFLVTKISNITGEPCLF